MQTPAMRGFYIVGEGNDGTGKSTQIELLAKWLEKEYGVETHVMQEPGGSPISNQIRTIIKDGSLNRDPITSLLLLTAARHETWFQEALPVLARGGIVLSARNYLSTEVYQGIAEGLGVQYVRDVTAAFMNQRYMTPDLLVVFELEESIRNKRISTRGTQRTLDTFESRGNDFQQKVDDGYHALIAERKYPAIDASRSIEIVQRNFRKIVARAMVGRALQ